MPNPKEVAIAQEHLRLLRLGSRDTVQGAVSAILATDGLKARRELATVTVMRYDPTSPIKDLKGNTITDEIDKDGYTLGSVLYRSALFVIAGENPPADEKNKSFLLAEKIQLGIEEGMVSVTIEEAADLRKKVGLMWAPTVMGRVWRLLERGQPDLNS